MQNEIEAADAYRQMAQQQVQQAQARVAVARPAGADREPAGAVRAARTWPSSRAASSRATMWYDLAREARRHRAPLPRHGDRGRGADGEGLRGRDRPRPAQDQARLRARSAPAVCLVPTALLLDIDFFSLDFVRTKSKKAPMKQIAVAGRPVPDGLRPAASLGPARCSRRHWTTSIAATPASTCRRSSRSSCSSSGWPAPRACMARCATSVSRSSAARTAAWSTQVYPADVMPLTDYDVRQDAVVFQLNAERAAAVREQRHRHRVATRRAAALEHVSTLSQILDVQTGRCTTTASSSGPWSSRRSRPCRRQAMAHVRSRCALTAPDDSSSCAARATPNSVLDPGLLPVNQADPQLKAYFTAGPRTRGDGPEGPRRLGGTWIRPSVHAGCERQRRRRRLRRTGGPHIVRHAGPSASARRQPAAVTDGGST